MKATTKSLASTLIHTSSKSRTAFTSPSLARTLSSNKSPWIIPRGKPAGNTVGSRANSASNSRKNGDQVFSASALSNNSGQTSVPIVYSEMKVPSSGIECSRAISSPRCFIEERSPANHGASTKGSSIQARPSTSTILFPPSSSKGTGVGTPYEAMSSRWELSRLTSLGERSSQIFNTRRSPSSSSSR